MVENMAQDTADKIVDKIVSADPNKTENAFAVLANKLYTDVYNSDPSNKAAAQFVNEVFKDINAQYTNGKSVPEELAFAWANEQTGHELPATGFRVSDLQSIQASKDGHVTELDKYMAGILLDNYGTLQTDAQHDATNRMMVEHECKETTKILDGYRKETGLAPDAPLPSILAADVCHDKAEPGDPDKAAGVIREITPTEMQTKLKDLDASRPKKLWFSDPG
jgi:hypothetical protein